MRKLIVILSVILLSSVSVYSQVDRKEVRKGNREYGRNDYKSAEISYRKALIKDSTSFAANYNLASSLYRQKNFQGAAEVLDKLKEQAKGNPHAADYWFNRGNAALQMKDYRTAVDAFKSSLMARPSDVEAKKSYLYAKKKLEQQQQQQQQDQDKNKDRNKDQNQNKDQNKDQNKNKDNSQDQNQNKDQDKDKGGQQQAAQGQSSISPQQVRQILNAMQNNEQKTKEKVDAEKKKGIVVDRRKNW